MATIVKAVTLGTSSVGGVSVSFNNWLAQFDSAGSYTPSVGNLVCIVGGSFGSRGNTSPPGTVGAGWTLAELNPPNYPSNRAYIYLLYKVWTSEDTVGEIAMNSANGALQFSIYEINQAASPPITQFASAPGSIANQPITTPSIVPATLNTLPIFVVQQLGNASSPAGPPSWAGATLDGYSYIDGADATPTLLSTAHGALTADTSTPITATYTADANNTSTTDWDTIVFLINDGTPPPPPPGIYQPWKFMGLSGRIAQWPKS